MFRTVHVLIALTALSLAVYTPLAAAAQPANCIWIEAEEHTRCNFDHFELSAIAFCLL